MPLYEYQCTVCGHRVEVLQRFDDPPLAQCENCGGEMKKLLSAPAFHLKGSGWYATDYAAKKSGGSESKSGDSPAGDGGKESGPKEGGKESGKGDGKGDSKESGSTPAESKPAASSSSEASKPAAPAKKDSAD